jgi:hypothetical protein
MAWLMCHMLAATTGPTEPQHKVEVPESNKKCAAVHDHEVAGCFGSVVLACMLGAAVQ